MLCSAAGASLVRVSNHHQCGFLIVVERSPLIEHGVTIFVVLGLMFAVMLIQAESAYNVLTYSEVDVPNFDGSLWSRLLFWPFYWGILLASTMVIFYPQDVPPDPLDAALALIESATGVGETEAQRD